MQQAFDVSQRRACRVVTQPRSTQRYVPRIQDDEAALVKQMHEIVRQHPRCGYAESFFSRLRDELLDRELLLDLREAKHLAALRQNEYNQRRPHSALGYPTPAAFAATCRRPAADAALGAPPQTQPGALPLDPDFFSSGERGEAELETKDLTLITTGT